MANVSKELFDNSAEVFGGVLYSHDKSFTQWLPVPVTGLTVPAGAPYNPLTTAFSGVHLRRPRQRPKQFFDSTDAVRAGSLGLKKGDVYQYGIGNPSWSTA